MYNRNIMDVVIASNALFTDDEKIRRFLQGYVVIIAGGPVLWKAGL